MTTHKILVAHDFSDASNRALTFAAEFARDTDAELEVAHVHPELYGGRGDLAELLPPELPESEARYLRFLQHELEDVVHKVVDSTPPIPCHIVRGDPVKRLEALAQEIAADVICLGATGCGLDRGATTERCAAEDPEIADLLQRELEDEWRDVLLPAATRIRVEPRDGSSKADLLASIARDEHADLLAVGTTSQPPLVRRWTHSTCEQLLQSAQTSLVCTPTTLVDLPSSQPPKNVMVGTDFSAAANAAVALAAHVTAPLGTVHLVHVLPGGEPGSPPRDIFEPESPSAGVDAPRARERLQTLKSLIDTREGRQVETHVLEASDVAEALCQAAERLRADLVCLGTQHRTRLGKALLGSVADGVVRRTTRPVLLSCETTRSRSSRRDQSSGSGEAPSSVMPHSFRRY